MQEILASGSVLDYSSSALISLLASSSQDDSFPQHRFGSGAIFALAYVVLSAGPSYVMSGLRATGRNVREAFALAGTELYSDLGMTAALSSSHSGLLIQLLVLRPYSAYPGSQGSRQLVSSSLPSEAQFVDRTPMGKNVLCKFEIGGVTKVNSPGNDLGCT